MVDLASTRLCGQAREAHKADVLPVAKCPRILRTRCTVLSVAMLASEAEVVRSCLLCLLKTQLPSH
jgi:hypothetical protein